MLRRLPRLPPRLIVLGLAVVSCGVFCLLALINGWVTPERLRALIAATGSLAMLSYVAAVIAMELLWLPRATGLILGGLLFGPLYGGLLSFCGDICGAVLCYWIARGAGRQWVERTLAQRPRARAVTELLARRRGVAVVAVLRVCPVAHYTLISYVAGLVGVPLGRFVLGTALGIVPAAILYPIAGDAMLRPTSPLFVGSVALVLVVLVVSLVAARRMLRQLPEGEGAAVGERWAHSGTTDGDRVSDQGVTVPDD